ncbi:hypothetical protein QR305_03460 [Bacteroides finegoldii]|uniref:Uncharacterized protein n=1 Tax=Bacteroides finegoldii CL09T03C10 TaxID=997888 RepID=K5CAF9_9BACE|nr:hypothetical protein HMPREF1057_03400 [Bacteroides finegoldii CL09T03C10]
MYIRSLPVEIEMMPIQQDSRKKDLQVDLKNAKEMKELYQGGKIPENRQNQGYVQRKKKRLHNLQKMMEALFYYLSFYDLYLKFQKRQNQIPNDFFTASIFSMAADSAEA